MYRNCRITSFKHPQNLQSLQQSCNLDHTVRINPHQSLPLQLAHGFSIDIDIDISHRHTWQPAIINIIAIIDRPCVWCMAPGRSRPSPTKNATRPPFRLPGRSHKEFPQPQIEHLPGKSCREEKWWNYECMMVAVRVLVNWHVATKWLWPWRSKRNDDDDNDGSETTMVITTEAKRRW